MLENPQAMILVQLIKEAETIVRLLNKQAGNHKYATSVLGGRKNPTKAFDEGKYKVAVTCGVAREGYDNSNVILCVVLRNIGMGTVMLEQFIGRCLRLNRTLNSQQIDRSLGIALSYPQFRAKKVYENMKKVIADHDPMEEDSDGKDPVEEDLVENGPVKVNRRNRKDPPICKPKAKRGRLDNV